MAKQTQQYDKIFKENFEEVIYSLARVVLGIDHTKLEEIPDETQYTIEKKPDFLKKVRGDNGAEDYILQIEVQTSDPKTMRKRMLIYYGFLYHSYEMPVKQYVLYIGKDGKAEMPTSIRHENLDFRFHLMNIVELDHEQFLYSEKPEDIVISILCDFKNKSAENIIDAILERLKRLKRLSRNDLVLGKYLRQLEILSNLRNLQTLTIKKLNDMSLIYDLESDIRYQQAYKQATEKYERLLELKEQEQQGQFITNLLNLRVLSKEAIAEVTNTTVDFVYTVEERLRAEQAERSNEK